MEPHSIAALAAGLLCLCLFRVPLFAQEARASDAINVHLHAMNPEDFANPALANFGAHRKTYTTNERDPEALLRRTIAEMDKNHISRGVISGDDDLVSKWVTQYPRRFLASYNHWCDGKAETVAKFEAEWKAGKWKAIGELGLPYGGHPMVGTRSMIPCAFLSSKLLNEMIFRCSFIPDSVDRIPRILLQSSGFLCQIHCCWKMWQYDSPNLRL
jgi:hypothetical protein